MSEAKATPKLNDIIWEVLAMLLAGSGILAREWHANGNPLLGKGCSEPAAPRTTTVCRSLYSGADLT